MATPARTTLLKAAVPVLPTTNRQGAKAVQANADDATAPANARRQAEAEGKTHATAADCADIAAGRAG